MAHCVSCGVWGIWHCRSQVYIQWIWIQLLSFCASFAKMSGPFKRRSSLKALPPTGAIRRTSIRRQSSVGLPSRPSTSPAQEVPWDVLDRCILPVICCHGAAFTLSNVLNVLKVSQVTTFTLFVFFTIVVLGLVFFYHNLKVSV